jgi:hypothetical protein
LIPGPSGCQVGLATSPFPSHSEAGGGAGTAKEIPKERQQQELAGTAPVPDKRKAAQLTGGARGEEEGAAAELREFGLGRWVEAAAEVEWSTEPLSG